MRVLHLIPFLWSGAGDVVTRLAASQAATHAVTLVSSGASRGQRDWPAYRRRLADVGVPIHAIDLFDRSPDVFWPSCAAVSALVDRWRPHVVHAHAGVPTAAAVLAARGARARPAVVSQFYNWGPDRPAWMNAMDLAALKSADAVVASATHYQRWLADQGVDGTRLHLVPWGLDDRWIAPPRRARVSARGPLFGFVGRIEPRKDQRGLVAALHVLRHTHPHARLELVGPVADEGYAEALRADIARLGLRAHVRLRGHVRDVGAALARWDAFVSLSRDEGQGLAVLEAMASDVPVVAWPAPGVEDVVVDGRTGVIVDGESPAAVAAAVARSLDASVRARLVRTARQLVSRRYRWQRTVTAIGAVYRQARQARPSR